MKLRDRARDALDSRLDWLRPVDRFQPPPKGWIRAIRDALGMSGPQLARRMGITQQSVQDMEKSEAAEKVRLETLRRAADALDCALVYALVPKKQLQQMVEDRARKIAIDHLSRVSHSMAIEDQAVANDDQELRVQEFIDNSLGKRDLWNGK